VFNEHSHIVAVKPSGNVYSFEAVDQLNIKPKQWSDLLTGETFTRADIITLQDPTDWSKRQIDVRFLRYISFITPIHLLRDICWLVIEARHKKL
jgi:hypothetical protein